MILAFSWLKINFRYHEILRKNLVAYFIFSSVALNIIPSQTKHLKLTCHPAICNVFSLALRRLPFSPKQRHCEPCDYGRIHWSMHGSGGKIAPLVMLVTRMVERPFPEKLRQTENWFRTSTTYAIWNFLIAFTDRHGMMHNIYIPDSWVLQVFQW